MEEIFNEEISNNFEDSYDSNKPLNDVEANDLNENSKSNESIDSGDSLKLSEIKKTNKNTKKQSSPLLKSRSSRVHKPNSRIFSADIEVIPQKKITRKKLDNAIKTINGKKVFKSIKKLKTDLDLNNMDIKNKKSKLSQIRNKNLKAKKLFIKNKMKLSAKNKLRISDNEDDSTGDNSIENKSINNDNLSKRESLSYKPETKLNYLLNKPPLTKNGKVRGRPRKPIVIDHLINVLNRNQNDVISKKNCDCEKKFKGLLENIDDSHKNQILKFRKELEEKDREKMSSDNLIALLKREVESLRNRMKNMENESLIKKELERIKLIHKYELSEIKKKSWCSNCEKEAFYFCCLNGFYCSFECQNQHWYSTHKKQCRNRQQNV